MRSSLQIHGSTRNGKSYLANCYYTRPFKVANITENRNDAWLRLMLMSSSPGILDTDDFTIEIVLDEECLMHLSTQAYQRLFSMQSGAQQKMNVTLRSGSAFIFLPHPSVPHENSIFTTRNKFHLDQNSFLIWGEVLTCGRKLNGEVFCFTKYHSITEIFLNSQLIVKENLLMAPASIPVNTIGQLEGYTHQASLICMDPQQVNITVIDDVHQLLGGERDMDIGVSSLQESGFIVRLLGNKAEQLYNCLQSITRHVTASRQRKNSFQPARYAS